MHPAVKVVYEGERGCGLRDKAGALYLRLDGGGFGCDMLPIAFRDCPTCAAMGLKCGVKPSRGWTWISPSKLFADEKCSKAPCRLCPMGKALSQERAGLLWIGEQYYATPLDFNREADRMGISRRLPADQIPRDFKVGETWVFLAHRKAVTVFVDDKIVWEAGVFRVFQPDRIEVVVDESTPDSEIERYLERGLTPVLVKAAVEQPVMELANAEVKIA